MHLYLTDEARKEIVEEKYHNKNGPQTSRKFQGLDVSRDTKGEYLYSYNNGFQLPLDEKIVKATHWFSYTDALDKHFLREPGTYRLDGSEEEKAWASVGFVREGSDSQSMFIAGTDYESVKKLFERIICGTLRPVRPLGAPQSGPSYKELQKQTEDLQEVLEDLKSSLSSKERLLKEATEDRIAFERSTFCYKVRNFFLTHWPSR